MRLWSSVRGFFVAKPLTPFEEAIKQAEREREIATANAERKEQERQQEAAEKARLLRVKMYELGLTFSQDAKRLDEIRKAIISHTQQSNSRTLNFGSFLYNDAVIFLAEHQIKRVNRQERWPLSEDTHFPEWDSFNSGVIAGLNRALGREKIRAELAQYSYEYSFWSTNSVDQDVNCSSNHSRNGVSLSW